MAKVFISKKNVVLHLVAGSYKNTHAHVRSETATPLSVQFRMEGVPVSLAGPEDEEGLGLAISLRNVL